MAASEWSEKKKMIVTASVGAGICALLGLWLNSLNGDLNAQKKILDGLKSEAGKLQAQVAEGPLRQAELEKKQSEFKAKEGKLPEGDRLPELLTDISRLGEKWKCSLTSTTFERGAPDPNKNYVRDVWHTKWTADFWSWCNLMNEMEERFPRFVAFENMTFTISNSGMIPTGTKHEISVDIVTYRYGKKVGGNP